MGEIQVTHTFVSGKAAAADATLVDGPNWDEIHVLTNPRLLFSDSCSSSGLPSGASTSGDIAFDSTRLRRELGGTQTSIYTTPSFALNGPLLVETEVENLNNYTTGANTVRVVRDTGSTVMGRIESQTDGNNVVTIDGSARWASGTTTAAGTYVRDDPEASHRKTIHVNEQKVIYVTDSLPGFGGSPGGTYTNSGKHPSGAVGFLYTATLSAGDNVHFEITTSSTRKVAIYLVRIWRGAITPL